MQGARRWNRWCCGAPGDEPHDAPITNEKVRNLREAVWLIRNLVTTFKFASFALYRCVAQDGVARTAICPLIASAIPRVMPLLPGRRLADKELPFGSGYHDGLTANRSASIRPFSRSSKPEGVPTSRVM